MKYLFTVILSLFLLLNLSAQKNFWSVINSVPIEEGHQIKTTNTDYFNLDFNGIKEKLKDVYPSSEIVVPLPISKTDFIDFKFQINTTMSEGLMEKFPEIRSYNGITLDRSNIIAKIDINHNYFRAMIMIPGKDILYIDPTTFTNTAQAYYILYTKKDLIAKEPFVCSLETDNGVNSFGEEVVFEKGFSSCELRTYRVAIAATGEYTIFHGGTVEDALAAQVTTLNRVNGIYERDIAITMTMIPNNEEIIYVDPNNDPYSNGNAGTMLGQNQSTLNSVIGSSNYDIGHVFGTNSGGVAYLGSVCQNQNKARGVTGSGAPIGDPFDIDYVAHEMGHQFGANHSFNSSCSGNRNNGTAMEPGSGSTIMAYAGVCNQSVQPHSDAYFHGISIQEIGTFVSGNSHSCPVKTPLNNTAPTVTTSYSGIIHIPASTPIMLKAFATDDEGDEVTYCWEQMDKEVTSASNGFPSENSTEGPSFRTFDPTTSPIRYLPSINNQLNSTLQWERLSTESRNYKFRVTVRDNSPAGGCTDSEDINFSSHNEAGPFLVTYPNDLGIVWQGLSTKEIQWDVAHTNESPINCQNVKIMISVDGGQNFDLLLENTPNTGSAMVVVPNVQTVSALIMVVSENESFFDISDKFFTINQNETSIDEEYLPQFAIYPNPAEESFRVSFEDHSLEVSGYRLYNVTGKIVQQSEKTLVSNQEINISRLTKGIYFFQTAINGVEKTLKIIKR